MSLSSRDKRGFTLVETLIVLVMVGTVLAIALPRISSTRQRAQLNGAAEQLVGDLRRARIEALKRNQSIRVLRLGSSSYTIDFIGAREFAGGVAFVSAPDSLRFASFGPPVSGPATFTLGLGAHTKRVSVGAAGQLEVR